LTLLSKAVVPAAFSYVPEPLVVGPAAVDHSLDGGKESNVLVPVPVGPTDMAAWETVVKPRTVAMSVRQRTLLIFIG
jgi:hypothetical protein